MTWTLEDSQLAYGLGSDDLHFLSISNDGMMQLSLEGRTFRMDELLDQVSTHFEDTKKAPSFTLRMPQLITTQISKLVSSFDDAMAEYGYNGKFKPLYPIKVNQHKREVTTVMESSPRYGLEAGTKSELFLILKMVGKRAKDKERIIMCNGVKDIEYVKIVKQAMADGFLVYISIESVTELKHVIKYLDHSKVNLFLRIKPYVSMHGYWGSSSGRNSKFGLSVADLATVADLLKEHHLANRLLGIHAHPGSQVANFYELAQYFKFLTKTYIQLRDIGFVDLQYINFGGGLPIDYDGRLPTNNLQRYATALIKIVTKLLDRHGIDHPHIMIEAGRAITALSSMLVIQPLEFHPIFPEPKEMTSDDLFDKFPDLELVETIEDILSMWEEWSKIPGGIDLAQLKERELYIGMVKKYLRRKFFTKQYSHQLLKNPLVEELISPDYFLLGNFSVFNGVCDYVMIGQYFPVYPIDNLHKRPQTLIRLVDITCDSDGEISIFRTKDSDAELLTEDGYPLTSKDLLEWKGIPVGDLSSLLDSYMIVPLVGAYQDIIEFDHNLIGDLPDVEMRIVDDELGLEVTTHAENVEELLRTVGYNLKNYYSPYISTEVEE